MKIPIGSLIAEALPVGAQMIAAIYAPPGENDRTNEYWLLIATPEQLVRAKVTRGWSDMGKHRVVEKHEQAWSAIQAVARITRKAKTWVTVTADGAVRPYEIIEHRGADFVATCQAQMALARKRESGTSVGAELEALMKLADQGALTGEEWTRAKEMFLGKAPDAQQQANHQLQQLMSLHKDGVISESEFNSKKWDVLAKRH